MRAAVFLLPLFLLPVLLPNSALAADTLSIGSAALQMIWALLVVVGLILAIYGLARRRLFLGKTGASVVNIVAMRPLMPKSTLALVEVRGREYLLGVSASGIHLLAEVPTKASEARPEFSQVLAEQQQ